MDSATVDNILSTIDAFSTLIEIFLSCLLGFVLGFAVEYLWDKKKNRDQQKKLIVSLLDELQSNKKTLSTIDDEKIYISPYSIPVWTGANKSGLILCLDKTEVFNKMVRFFSLLEEANQIETTTFKVLNINPQANRTAVMENVIACRNELRKEIDGTINMIKGE